MAPKKRGWSALATAYSQSAPGKTYTISRHEGTGRLGCSCPAFRFAGETDAAGRRTCKHLKGYLYGTGVAKAFKGALAAKVEQAVTVAQMGAALDQLAGALAKKAPAVETVPTVGPLARLLEAADAVGVRGRLTAGQWAGIAARLGEGDAGAVPAAPVPDQGDLLRVIVLED